jgi:hypothetical protein
MEPSEPKQIVFLSTPPRKEWWAYKIYFVFSLILAVTCWVGFSVSPAIYHGAASAWHGIGMLTDVCTCALPLFNWALACASLANIFLFVFTWFKPEVLDRKIFYITSLSTILIMSPIS